jgi:hypothetical protein
LSQASFAFFTCITCYNKKLTPFRNIARQTNLSFVLKKKEGILKIPMFGGGKTAFSKMLS